MTLTPASINKVGDGKHYGISLVSCLCDTVHKSKLGQSKIQIRTLGLELGQHPATPIRRAISRIGTPPTNFNRRTSRTWRMIVLSAGIRPLLWNSQRRGSESASRGTCHPGRDHPGMVGDIISERWAELPRNGWAASFLVAIQQSWVKQRPIEAAHERANEQ